MAKIQQLSPHVADLIAAGEVVERPASAVKELVENSIDAGAKHIVVEVQNVTFLRVTDDGCGMLPEDAETAFLRHATSKLRTERDLEAIHTLGFRGEALAAISAVSRIDLMTKTEDAPLGISLHLEGGVITEREEAGCPTGTTIIVRDLFFNTPARMKFMKRDNIESAAVVSAVAKLALAHPEVSMRVIRDGKEELNTYGDGSLQNTIRAVMGKQCAQEMVELNSHYEKYTLTGYISKPNATRGNRSNQIFFVNGRHVRSKTMCAALESAYANRMMVGRYPSCVLHLQLPENMVDVNVHPAKIEVKFVNERDVFDCIRYGAEGALDRTSGRAQMQLPKQEAPKPEPPQPPKTEAPKSEPPKAGAATLRSPSFVQASRPAKQEVFRKMTAEDYRAFAKTLEEAPRPQPSKELLERFAALAPSAPKAQTSVQEKKPAEQPETIVLPEPTPEAKTEPIEQTELASLASEEKPWRFIGQVLDTYILIEQDQSLLMIDKHAAHERVLFEKFRSQTEPIMPQLLLTPLLCDMEREEAALLSENETLLSEYGFSVSDYGDGTLAVHQIPADLKADDACDTLCTIASELKSGKHRSAAELRDTLLHTVACKAAIKGGRHSDIKELEAIAREVMRREDLKYCPHGRPICVELTRKQIEKQFKR